MNRWLMLAALLCFAAVVHAQQPLRDTLIQKDTGAASGEVIVSAFHSLVKWKASPAAVATVTRQELNRYAPVSLVPVLNALPGIRMEERSPGSYRLSVRGSLLRSPFGVRNVKVYWNDIPLTDAGGNTYLNLVDISQLSGAEIIKGPVASVYGAGTGGALLLHTDLPYTKNSLHQYDATMSGGSYGLLQQHAGWRYTDSNLSSYLEQSHLQSDGYRQQSALRRDVIKWESSFGNGQRETRLLLFYTDMYYQTPGGITLAQMQANPVLARQPAGGIPGAVQQQAAVYNKTFFVALQHEVELGHSLRLKCFAEGNTTGFKNPFITNYEVRQEENAGAGIQLQYHFHGKNDFQWNTGGEWLYNHAVISDYGNSFGVMDTIQFKDNVYANQWFLFSQASFTIADRWNITAGASINDQSYRYKRISDPAVAYNTAHINSVFTPRIAGLYRITAQVALYALAAKGFSPPALAEVRPSDGNYYGDLQAESGWNYEAGIKGFLLEQRLQFDIAAYYFSLHHAIVRKNNAAGAEYFVNAGSTTEKGMEALLKYRVLTNTTGFFSAILVWGSYSYQPYRFTAYRQDGIDYSGNKLTGVPTHIWVTGADIEMKRHWYVNTSLNMVSSLPLTDANDATADPYRLLQLKAGYKCGTGKLFLHFFIGADNLLDQLYSLGNDINAAGKRYYNPAPARNFFMGIRCLLQ